MRLDPDLTEPRRITIDAKQGPEKFDIWTAAPGMAIRSGKFDVGVFRPGCEPPFDILSPYPKPVHISISQSGPDQRLVQIIFEIDSALRQGAVRQHSFAHGH